MGHFARLILSLAAKLHFAKNQTELIEG